ncbi:D-alanyl-D-alanine carboxypeptidase [Rhodobacter sp. JA431]|uniref:D-alanyl-D-alanine carboxypeptidase family protein n=1 Tax=Rhodobacter sp. JA431 TaxID=570013 RepID=UPI000BD4FF5B|nr:D-alanyl-D-alanine carboxypeptidase family protein [Rhodobacter sp. JA431]SOC04091.1 D-alanyl-D-alanine carboxypeptidase [Rhodobacter sp. JA431]
MPVALWAAPFAAYVIDARSGEVLYAKNAETRLHPASLTKMMTLYIAFQEIEAGRLSLDTMVTVSANAAGQPPSRVGLKAGQKIALRYLIRAAAVKSANDAAAAIGDFIGGDEAKFAARMTRTARALGMTKTTFKNANGLTREGHLSTAHDMTTLGRHLLFDFPQYYNLFSRRSADAGIARVYNTNRRFLDAYEGADGIKTGYTVAAGFNLVGSAKRGNKRIIATVFGGTSTASRNAKMAELLDLGFARAPNRARTVTPEPAPMLLADAAPTSAPPALKRSPRPMERPAPAAPEIAAAIDTDAIAAAVALAAAAPPPAPAPEPVQAAEPQETLAATIQVAQAQPNTLRPAPKPAHTAPVQLALAEDEPAGLVEVTAPQPETLAMLEADDSVLAQGDTDATAPIFIQTATAQPETLAMSRSQASRNDTVILAALTPPAPMPQARREVVARASSSGGRQWGVSLGKYNSQYAAEQVLLKTALMESTSLGEGLRKVASRPAGHEALFVGLTRADADLACARLSARAVDCTVIGP